MERLLRVFIVVTPLLAAVHCLSKDQYPCNALFTGDTNKPESQPNPKEEITLTTDQLDELLKVPEFNLQAMCGIQTPSDIPYAGKTEGDMAGDIQRARNSLLNSQLARSAITGNWRLWPEKTVPYVLNKNYGAYSRSVIAKAMRHIEDNSCVKFVPKQDRHNDYLSIYRGDGCFSFVGKTGGTQEISLAINCMDKGTVIHELMHALGFFHEQSRNNRDEFVEIVWKNIDWINHNQFQKYGLFEIRDQGIGYDYASIMHYGRRSFSVNGLDTIRPKPGKPGAEKIGQRSGLSQKDIEKLNKLYSCPSVSSTTPRTTTAPPCEDSRSACKYFKRWLNVCERVDGWFNRDMCRKSCDLCNVLAEQPSVTTENPNCKNLHGMCETWANSPQKYCTQGKSGTLRYMRKNCNKSCKFC